MSCLQLRANVFKWLVFHLCLWRKSYYMKRGIKHDKVSLMDANIAVTLASAASLQYCQLACTR
jgi:hypothetical protein